MARPKKSRVICSHPRHLQFLAKDARAGEVISMSADEYEVLRLHDLEHFTQSEVARQMLISRTGVTALLASAHEKLADSVVNGKRLVIELGACSVCEIGASCPHRGCCKKKHRCAASCRAHMYACGKTDPEIN